MEHMNVESFNLDHTKVAAPFIRLADRKTLPHGDIITKFDIRFCQPNSEHLDTRAVHSIEHSFAEYARNHSDSVIDFSPMGCRTGFYLILVGEHEISDVAQLVEETFRDILSATHVPAANDVQCGWGEHHSLEEAQKAVSAMIEKRTQWEQVMA